MHTNKPPFWCYFSVVFRGSTKGYYRCKKTGENFIEKTKSPRPGIVNCFINIIIASASVFVTGIILSLIFSNATSKVYPHIGLYASIIFVFVFAINITVYWSIQFNKTTFVKKTVEDTSEYPLDIKSNTGLY